MKFKPFKNESQTFSVGDLNFENRLDRISCYGNIDITKDRKGLADAVQLQDLVNAMVSELKSAELPDCIEIEAPITVKNPLE